MTSIMTNQNGSFKIILLEKQIALLLYYENLLSQDYEGKEKRLSCVPLVAFRGVTRSRPPGWGRLQPVLVEGCSLVSTEKYTVSYGNRRLSVSQSTLLVFVTWTSISQPGYHWEKVHNIICY